MNDSGMDGNDRGGWDDGMARAALERYERTVRFLARRYRPRGPVAAVLDLDDLMAVGRMAVLEALERYEAYGIEESTFVRTRVQQRMIDAIRQVDTRTREENRLLRAHASGDDSVDERRARTIAARRTVSLDQPMGEMGPMIELLESDTPNAEVLSHRVRQHAELRAALGTLPDRQREAVSLCLEQGLRLREIGERMGISESRVCQLQKTAVRRLYGHLSAAA